MLELRLPAAAAESRVAKALQESNMLCSRFDVQEMERMDW